VFCAILQALPQPSLNGGLADATTACA